MEADTEAALGGAVDEEDADTEAADAALGAGAGAATARAADEEAADGALGAGVPTGAATT